MTNPLACPQCSYERKATDSAPLTECPACRVVFSRHQEKFSKTSAPRFDPANVPARPPDKVANAMQGTMSVLAGVAATIAALFVWGVVLLKGPGLELIGAAVYAPHLLILAVTVILGSSIAVGAGVARMPWPKPVLRVQFAPAVKNPGKLPLGEERPVTEPTIQK